MKSIFYWWLFICLNVLSFGVIGYYDGFRWLWATDITKLSYLILISYIFVTVYIGKLTFHRPAEHLLTRKVDLLWFYAQACSDVGMLGTIVGFVYVLITAFSGLDFQNVEQAKEIIKAIGFGMGTALVTTLVGLTANLFIKIQIANLEYKH
jgi:hypothetical protein